MFFCFAEILKSPEFQSVLSNKKQAKMGKIAKYKKLQITDYQCNMLFLFLLFCLLCTGSGYYKSLVNPTIYKGLYIFDLYCWILI